MAQGMNTLIHVATLGIYAFTLYYTFNILFIPILPSVPHFDPGQLKYLTVWNLIIQALFFLICIINDFVGTNAVNPKKPPLVRKMKDYLHASIAFPVAMFVGTTFWSLMFVDRELVLPKALDPYFPWWLNHLMHTMIVVSTLTEMILAPRQYPKRSHALSSLIVFQVMYLIWMHIIHYKSGIWVYPIMDVLTLPQRLVFLAIMMIFTLILYFMGEALNNFVWGSTTTLSKNGKKKKLM